MELLLLSGYLASPIFVFLISYFLLHKWPVSNGIWLILSVIRVLFLILLFFESSTGLGHIIGEVGDPRIWKFSLDLALNKSHLGFLFIVDFCFLISNHSIHKSIRHRNSIGFWSLIASTYSYLYHLS